MKITESPDESVSGGVIEINYHKDKTFSVEFEKKFWKRSCVIPIIGKFPNFETKTLVIEDPKLDSFFFFNYFTDSKFWVFGSISRMDFCPIKIEDELHSKFNLGDTKIKFFSQLDYLNKDREKEVFKPPSFLDTTIKIERESDSVTDFEFENFLEEDFNKISPSLFFEDSSPSFSFSCSSSCEEN